MTPQRQKLELLSETVSLNVNDQGQGRAFLILHGGAGPGSVSGLANALSKSARAVVPTYPGFNGEPRPDWFASVDDLALANLALIEKLGLSKVVVIGNSIGGWIASEIALRHSPRVAGMVLLNAVGIDTGSSDKTITDMTKVPPAERASYSFHDPKRFAIAPTTPDALAIMANNQQTLRTYAGSLMYDPGLRSRLAGVSTPTMVAWGASDRVVDVDYGRLFASSIPGARFELVSEAGHFPQIERLDEVMRLIGEFDSKI
ncbi:MAG: alpha/beta hydrolase [Thaumarchaeota archaeon]|nr:alpha/beta hydrolase [Nitrososphaerota archaeon]